MTIWKMMALGLIPLAILELMLALSGIKRIQRAIFKITSIPVQIGVVNMSWNLLVVLIAGGLFGSETYKLRSSPISMKDVAKYPTGDRMLMKHWRSERNWWICLFTLVLWILVWRVGVICTYFINRIDSLEISRNIPKPSAPPATSQEVPDGNVDSDEETDKPISQKDKKNL
eukprot:Platyproteum_vivax@DN3075_c0_g1_i1.p1